ncbi:pitrilysin family protein [Paracoccus sp. (in: a-proteobacteria)]|uniref:M16 family metallopeptidase n=1 Tax=Paracoccus sp. TaxID=267 RepID=UPI0026E016B7|nr:pitrilysin family protein [Paracoccus sp. (in: a-proteobacteria)]MDO5648632.1 pitrilysin family protein [Paracoccus sp. (in: a-proteobacteria)]
MIRATFTLIATLIAAPVWAIDIQQVTSPGGIRAWLVQDDSIPFVAVNIQFAGGASLDAPDARGAITLMTALLDEGAADRDATQFATAMQDLGAQITFDAGADSVSVGFRALTEHRDASADLLAQALTEPRFDDDAVERVRAQVQAAIRSDATNPRAIGAREMARQAWGDHPYATSINGTAESVAALTVDDLRTAKDRVLARDRIYIGAAGDINADDLGRLIDRILGDLPETGAPLPEQAELALTGGVTVIDWDSPQTLISFAGAGLPILDPDYFPAMIADHVLGGGGFSSRLMDEVREKRGLTYGIGTGLSNAQYGQMWQGNTATANETAAQVVDLIRAEWDRMADGISEQERADAQTYLTGDYALRFDGNRRIAGILSGMQMIGLPADYVNTRNDQVMAVTADDVARVAARLLDAGKLRFVLVGRPDGIAAD